MKKPLTLFMLLQAADLATTLVALKHGSHEANPLVAASIRCGLGVLGGLLAAKLIACALALASASLGRMKAIRMASVVYGCVVGWNLLAITLS